MRETENEVANSEGGIKRIWRKKRELDEISSELEELGFGQRGRELDGKRDGFGKRRRRMKCGMVGGQQPRLERVK